MSITGSTDKFHADVALTPMHALKAPSLHTLAARLATAETEAGVRELLGHLQAALTAAAAKAPVRKGSYALGVLPAKRAVGVELVAEALWRKFGPDGADAMFVFGSWHVLGVDVALSDRRSGQAVPVLCLESRTRLPAPVQLTRLPRPAALFTAIAHAVSRAIAIKKAWPRRLRADWLNALEVHGFGTPELDSRLDQLSICVLAPSEDWRDLTEATRPGAEGMSTTTLQAVHQLIAALRRHGFDVALAGVEEQPLSFKPPGPHVWPVALPRFGKG